MHSGILLSSILQQLVLLVTFGITSPPLAIAVLVTIVSLTWQWQIFIGRYLLYASTWTSHHHGEVHQTSRSPEAESETIDGNHVEVGRSASTPELVTVTGETLLENSVQGVWLGPVQSVWTMIDISALFFSVLLFDIAGDEIGWFSVVCCFTVPTLSVPLLMRAIYREYWRYLFCTVSSQNKIDIRESLPPQTRKNTSHQPETMNEIHNFEFSLQTFAI
jgi:hypothetical protein